MLSVKVRMASASGSNSDMLDLLSEPKVTAKIAYSQVRITSLLASKARRLLSQLSRSIDALDPALPCKPCAHKHLRENPFSSFLPAAFADARKDRLLLCICGDLEITSKKCRGLRAICPLVSIEDPFQRKGIRAMNKRHIGLIPGTVAQDVWEEFEGIPLDRNGFE